MASPPFPPPKLIWEVFTSHAGQNSTPVTATEGNCSKPNRKAKVSAKSSSKGMKQNKFLTVTLKPYMLSSRQLRLPRPFARGNGINNKEAIILVDKHGVKWPSYLGSINQHDFYITKGWLGFCAANGIKIGEKFTLEFVRGEYTTPMLKFFSIIKIEQASRDVEETVTQVQKRARVSGEGGTSRCVRASNKCSGDGNNLHSKKPLHTLLTFDQVTKVKQRIMDTLTRARWLRSELEIKEQNLEAWMQEIDALGKQVLEMQQNTQVSSSLKSEL